MERTRPATVYAVPFFGQDEVQSGAFAGGIRVCVRVCITLDSPGCSGGREATHYIGSADRVGSTPSGGGLVVDVLLVGRETFYMLTKKGKHLFQIHGS